MDVVDGDNAFGHVLWGEFVPRVGLGQLNCLARISSGNPQCQKRFVKRYLQPKLKLKGGMG